MANTDMNILLNIPNTVPGHRMLAEQMMFTGRKQCSNWLALDIKTMLFKDQSSREREKTTNNI